MGTVSARAQYRRSGGRYASGTTLREVLSAIFYLFAQRLRLVEIARRVRSTMRLEGE